jgi:Uma2 family endonuclease
MNVTLTEPWTVERFLSWAARQEERCELDGKQPVAMTGGTGRHNRISHNIYAALRTQPRGSRCSYFGPDLGVRTGGEKIRFPDALITCTKFPETEPLAPDAVVVFEVLSPDSGRRDRIEKVRDYASVASIRRYVIVESSGIGLLVLHPQQGDTAFTALSLSGEDTLALPEVGIEIPVAEIYEDVDFGDAAPTP